MLASIYSGQRGREGEAEKNGTRRSSLKETRGTGLCKRRVDNPGETREVRSPFPLRVPS